MTKPAWPSTADSFRLTSGVIANISHRGFERARVQGGCLARQMFCLRTAYLKFFGWSAKSDQTSGSKRA